MEVDPESLLGTENRTRCVQALGQLKPLRMKSKRPADERQAAVLVPLCLVDSQLSLLYTVRSANLRTNRGEVSFPGGMQDNTDASLVETALREAEEELGIQPSDVDVWAPANFVGTYSGKVAVMPVLGYVGKLEPAALRLSAAEVETAFAVPLKALCDPTVARHTQFRSRMTVLPAFRPAGRPPIWGLTAVITHLVLSTLAPQVYKKRLRLLRNIQP